VRSKVDWFKVSTLLFLGAALIWIAIVLGRSPIGLALGQTTAPRWSIPAPVGGTDLVKEYTEVATYVAKVGVKHQLCWSNPNTSADGSEDTVLQLAYRRYRIEGGPVETSNVLQYAQWVKYVDPATGQVVPRSYCTQSQGLPRAGHWVYEAMMCRVPYVSDSASCSTWVSSIIPSGAAGGGGEVDARPKGWWVYAYLAAPTGVGT
jgi:hypothetical protein